MDAKKRLLLLTIPIPIPTQTTVRFLPDGYTLAVLSRRTGLTLHRLAYDNGKLRIVGSEAKEGFINYAFGTAPSLMSPYICMTSAKDGRGVIWNVMDGSYPCTIDNSPGIQDMAISPDSKSFVTANAKYPAQVWAFPSGIKTAELPNCQGAMLAFSPSGAWLGSTGISDHLLWDTKTWTKGPSLPPEVEAKTGHVAFSFDGKLMAVRMRDQNALINLPARNLIGILDQHVLHNPLCCLRFSPDGTQVASQGKDNSLIIWNLEELQSELRKLNLQW